MFQSTSTELPDSALFPALPFALPIGGSPAPSLQGLRVLVVDDEEDACSLAAMALSQAGADAYEAWSAIQALEFHEQQCFDVLICDIAMPVHDGHWLIQQVRGLPSRLSRAKALSLSAHGLPKDRRAALHAGFETHLVKPISSRQLVAAVARLLEPVTV